MRKRRYQFPEYNWIVDDTQFCFRLNITEDEVIEYPNEIRHIDRVKACEYMSNRRNKMTEEEKEKVRLYNKRWNEDNKEHVAETSKQHRLKNIEVYKGYDKERYMSDPEGQRQRVRDYRNNNHEAVKLSKLKQDERRTEWGWAPINKHFEGSDGHHLHIGNHSDGIYIPSELHKSISHNFNDQDSINDINNLAFEWLVTQEIL